MALYPELAREIALSLMNDAMMIGESVRARLWWDVLVRIGRMQGVGARRSAELSARCGMRSTPRYRTARDFIYKCRRENGGRDDWQAAGRSARRWLLCCCSAR